MEAQQTSDRDCLAKHNKVAGWVDARPGVEVYQGCLDGRQASARIPARSVGDDDVPRCVVEVAKARVVDKGGGEVAAVQDWGNFGFRAEVFLGPDRDSLSFLREIAESGTRSGQPG